MANGTLNIPKGAPIVYVSFSADINPSTCESLIAAMSSLANLQVVKVHLLISTPGGNVMNGLNLYNVLRGLPFELTTHNVGSVNSIGNAIFLAGSKRYAAANATFMFHGVGFDIKQPNQRFEEKNLNELLDSLLNDQKRIGGIIAQHTNLTGKQIAGLFRQASTKDADWAINKGIIDEIRDVQIPKGSPVISLVFKRQGV